MKTHLLMPLSVLLMAQCGGHNPSTQPSPQAEKATVAAPEKRCDFSDYKPLQLQAATLGSPVLRMPRPEYPSEARERKVAGPVTVRVLINVHTGHVEQACAVEGDESLKRAAEMAALKVQLSPYNNYIQQRYTYAAGFVIYNFEPQ
jgi:outer membrane biosynthesis protein TonB